ncbi:MULTISPECIES: hypothetical protein [Aquibaculum]|uniref:Type II toxin-antitoxin system ParD family antitoxin n=1 Tax=Aquibaculum arenosum TaxID=3032591 RepID=A0ABT5YNB9_9PROT|nr:hypothetical protein [Fodinicurvata sp. CAU 1616]MDF2096428.1 hypothetical protein [Fodinicurvata sp. CAU 1616]
MTVKTTLSFTERHHRYLQEKVAQGEYASPSAAVAAALEQVIRDEEERSTALAAAADEIVARMKTPRAEFVEPKVAFAQARIALQATRKV